MSGVTVERGVTLCCYEPELRRSVALKVVSLTDSTYVRLLRREARILASLSHPGFVGAYEAAAIDQYCVLVMEFIQAPLSEVISETEGLSSQRAISVLLELSDCIDQLHRNGLIHTRLDTDRTHLDDAGAARVTALFTATRIGQSVIAPIATSAPELKSPDPVVQPANDIWGLGLVLLCMLTGTADSRMACEQRATLLETINDRVSNKLAQLVRVCLDDEPRARPQSCAELSAALRACSGKEDGAGARVFISHAASDRQFVEQRILRTLHLAGYETWYSRTAITGAAEWERSILAGLASCDWFLVVVSEASAKSEWVKDEVFWAVENRPGRILPVCIDATDLQSLHIRLARLQTVQLERPGAGREILDVLRD